MEEQKTNPEPENQASTTGKPPSASELNIIIARKVGRMRSFRVSSGLFFGALVFFILFIAASVVVFNWYFEQLRTAGEREKQVERMRTEVEGLTRELHRSRQHLAILKEVLEDRQASKVSSAGAEQSREKGMPARAEEPKGGTSEGEKVRGAVAVEDLEAERSGQKLMVRFRLVNTLEEEAPVSGYIHMIAVNRDSEPNQFWTYPKVALRDGVPVDCKRGQRFKIRRFKRVDGEYFLDADNELPSSVKVLVYDQDGVLLFERAFELEHRLAG